MIELVCVGLLQWVHRRLLSVQTEWRYVLLLCVLFVLKMYSWIHVLVVVLLFLEAQTIVIWISHHSAFGMKQTHRMFFSSILDRVLKYFLLLANVPIMLVLSGMSLMNPSSRQLALLAGLFSSIFFLSFFFFFTSFFVCFVFRTTFDVGTLGAKEITKLPPLRMIERHYLEDTLLRSFDFTYGPIELPSLRNCWEFTYDMPPLNGEQGLSWHII